MALDWLANAGMDLSQVRVASSGTGTGVTVIMAQPEHRFILTYPGTMFEMSYADLNLDYIFSARHLHLSSYFLHKALRPHIADLFREPKPEASPLRWTPTTTRKANGASDLLDMSAVRGHFLPERARSEKDSRNRRSAGGDR